VRDAVRVALHSIAARFSDDAPLVDLPVLRSRHSALDAWPADAQLGLFVLAWALGSGFAIQGFRERVNALVPDFAGAARAIGPGSTPTLISVGSVVRCTFLNAAIVLRWNLDSKVLYWPSELSRSTGAIL
jgi:hypothetical protein